MKQAMMRSLVIATLVVAGAAAANDTHRYLKRMDLGAAMTCVRADGKRSKVEVPADKLENWLIGAADAQPLVVQDIKSIKVLSALRRGTLNVELIYLEGRVERLRVRNATMAGLDEHGKPARWTLATCRELIISVHEPPPRSRPATDATAH